MIFVSNGFGFVSMSSQANGPNQRPCLLICTDNSIIVYAGDGIRVRERMSEHLSENGSNQHLAVSYCVVQWLVPFDNNFGLASRIGLCDASPYPFANQRLCCLRRKR